MLKTKKLPMQVHWLKWDCILSTYYTVLNISVALFQQSVAYSDEKPFTTGLQSIACVRDVFLYNYARIFIVSSLKGISGVSQSLEHNIQFNPWFNASRLSASLLNITKNKTYLDAAYLTTTFIQAHLYDVDTMQVPGGAFRLDRCDSGHPLSYDAGMYLGALSTFADITGNITLRDQWVQISL